MKTLRNKQKREQEFQNEPDGETPKKTVHPSVLCSIIEDLERHSIEKLQVNYNLNDEFFQILGNHIKIAKTKIDLKGDSKVSINISKNSSCIILTNIYRRKNLMKNLILIELMESKAPKTQLWKINWRIYLGQNVNNMPPSKLYLFI